MKFNLLLYTCMVMLMLHGTYAESDTKNDSFKRRHLRRGGSSRSSSRSAYYKPSYSNAGKISLPSYSYSYYSSSSSSSPTYKYGKTPTTTQWTYMKYFYDGKTYRHTYSYYLPPNFSTKNGYYSPEYLKIYYNGYGYNFYYGVYGYYQNSSNVNLDDQRRRQERRESE